jgi:hypothetical protein
MPRIDRNRSLPLTYRPSPPPLPTSSPEEALRAIWEEFQRISLSLSDYDRPVSVSVQGADVIQVGPTATYTVLLDASPTVRWERPGDTFNAGTGTYTAPQEGLYLVMGSLVSDPFPAPATRSYQVLLRITHTPLGGAPVQYVFGGGGVDDQYVTATANVLLALQQGDTLQFAGAGVHPSKSGNNNVAVWMNVVRESGLGNAD